VLAHPEARLSDADKAALIEGLTATLNAPAH
jgi:phenylpyruvate tautomerase PptA (4-oxalocrotonate tautomerase family)